METDNFTILVTKPMKTAEILGTEALVYIVHATKDKSLPATISDTLDDLIAELTDLKGQVLDNWDELAGVKS